MIASVTTQIQPMSIDAFLNNFAARSFRDNADGDYIAARMLYRNQLIPQFHWSALQAVEKYMKYILLLNRVPAAKLGHDLGKALQLLDTKLPYKVRLSPTSLEFIEHLDRFGQFRYMDVSYYTVGWELERLDQTVWELRRYCQVLEQTIKLHDGTKKSLQPLLLKGVEQAESKPPHRFRLMFGQLEKIIKSRRHPARAALLWQNRFFGNRQRKSVRIPRHSHSANAPLALNPKMLDEVAKYVHIPKRAKLAAQASLAASNANSKPAAAP